MYLDIPKLPLFLNESSKNVVGKDLSEDSPLLPSSDLNRKRMLSEAQNYFKSMKHVIQKPRAKLTKKSSHTYGTHVNEGNRVLTDEEMLQELIELYTKNCLLRFFDIDDSLELLHKTDIIGDRIRLNKSRTGQITPSIRSINQSILIQGKSENSLENANFLDFSFEGVCQVDPPMNDRVAEDRKACHRRQWLNKAKKISLRSKLTVLVVDDSSQERKQIKQMLIRTEPECQVDEASDGLSAFETVEKNYKRGHAYHLIIIDFNMPKYNGYDGISRIRDYEQQNDIPKSIICLLSADDILGDKMNDEDIHDKLTDYGIQRVMTKPLRKENLKTLLDYISQKYS